MRITAALVTDTFREAFARKIFWGLFALSTLMIFFFLFLMKIDVVQGAIATVSLFGRDTGPSVSVDHLVLGVYASIATFLYTWGLFLAVFASAGLVPSLLEPGRIELLLSKPVARYHILLGRYLGNVLVITLNIAYLVLGVWIILGAKTGLWGPRFLVAILCAVFIFAVMLSVVFLIGVLFDSAALAIMVAVALMILSPILAQTGTVMKLLSSEWSRQLWRALYEALPKVYDVGKFTIDVVTKRTTGGFSPFVTSAIFAVVIMSAAVYIFHKRDF